MIDPSALTGEYVKTIRSKHKISRDKFQQMCGIGGKSAARINNIENKDSWKDGDREAIARVLSELEGSNAFVPPQDHAASVTPSFDVVIDASPIDDDDDDDYSMSTKIIKEFDAVVYAYIDDQDDDEDEQYDLHDLFTVDGELDQKIEPFVITNSQAAAFKRCKRKWWLSWYRGLQPRVRNLTGPLATGSRVHYALQSWYVGDDVQRVDPRDALERALTEDWTTIYNDAVAKGHDDFVLAGLTDEFNKVATLERAMVEGYVEWLQETGADSELKIISSEAPVVAHLFDYTYVSGLTQSVNTAGLLDARVVRTSDNVRLFIDHKTVGDLTSPVKTLPQNEQMLHYHLLEWLASSDGEERCDGALYNMLRKVKRTAQAKPPFYDRAEVRHNVHELESYKRRLVATTRDIMHARERLDNGAEHLDVAYPTPTGNCTWDCDFYKVCTMFDDGSRVEDALESLYVKVNPNERYDTTMKE